MLQSPEGKYLPVSIGWQRADAGLKDVSLHTKGACR